MEGINREGINNQDSQSWPRCAVHRTQFANSSRNRQLSRQSSLSGRLTVGGQRNAKANCVPHILADKRFVAPSEFHRSKRANPELEPHSNSHKEFA
jgi:hypothetical protein